LGRRAAAGATVASSSPTPRSERITDGIRDVGDQPAGVRYQILTEARKARQ
jgi:hypothetical protein